MLHIYVSVIEMLYERGKNSVHNFVNESQVINK